MKLTFGFLSLFLIIFIFIPGKAYAKKIEVGNTVKSINEALKIARNGDQIYVKKSVYHEGNLVINKSIELIGENMPELNGDNKYEIITVKADGVKIKGFHLKNAGFSDINDLAGIRVENVSNCTIQNNYLQNTPFGIYFSNTDSCIINNNLIKGLVKAEVTYGNAIHIWKSKKIRVENNDLTGHRDGIYLEFVKNSLIINNNSYNNLRYGLHFMFSDGNSYKKNIFTKNGAGVAVMYTHNIEMIENRFENNWGPASYGLLLKDIKNSKIKKNIFKNNTVGIYMDGALKLDIDNNSFFNNGYALRLIGNSYDNTIQGNNFLANSFDVITNSSGQMNNNTFSENYWDKYNGYDLNKDKIGDVPYRPVSLFSIVMEKIPYSVLLLRSFFVSILDISEKVLPVFTPKTVIDNKPLMVIRR